MSTWKIETLCHSETARELRVTFDGDGVECAPIVCVEFSLNHPTLVLQAMRLAMAEVEDCVNQACIVR